MVSKDDKTIKSLNQNVMAIKNFGISTTWQTLSPLICAKNHVLR